MLGNSTSKRTQKAIQIALQNVLIKFKTTKKELMAILFSALVSAFGVYQIIVSRMSKEDVIYTMIGLVIILAILDQVKRRGLISLFNDMIKDKILGRENSYTFAKIILGLTVGILFMLDVVGSWSTSEYISQSYKNSQITKSEEFIYDNMKKEENKANNQAYLADMATWNAQKADAFEICHNKYIGWKKKYEANCKADWLKFNPAPNRSEYINYSGMSANTFNAVKSKTEDEFLVKYLFWFLLFFFMSLTIIAQKLTVSDTIEEYKEIMEDLTPKMIGVYIDRIKKLISVKANNENEVSTIIEKREVETDAVHRQIEEHQAVKAIEEMRKAIKDSN